MTTATLVVGNRTMETAAGPRRKTLEDLVEGLMDALTFKTETAEPGAARSIHEARRLRQGGMSTGPWRSSPRWTRRVRRRTRRGGPSPSGSSW